MLSITPGTCKPQPNQLLFAGGDLVSYLGTEDIEDEVGGLTACWAGCFATHFCGFPFRSFRPFEICVVEMAIAG